MRGNKSNSRHNHRRSDSVPPSKSGWYWFTGFIFEDAFKRNVIQSIIPPEVVRVYYINNKQFMAQFAGSDVAYSLECLHGVWSGPMAMPYMSHKAHDLWAKNHETLE